LILFPSVYISGNEEFILIELRFKAKTKTEERKLVKLPFNYTVKEIFKTIQNSSEFNNLTYFVKERELSTNLLQVK
jgi:hypothetical protein